MSSASISTEFNVHGTKFKIVGRVERNTQYQCPHCDKIITCTGTTRLKCHIIVVLLIHHTLIKAYLSSYAF